MSGKIQCRGVSHCPPGVPVNADEFLIADLNRSLRVHQTSMNLDEQTRLFGNSAGKILVLADGVGSDRTAERASTVAVDAVSNYVLNGMHWLSQSDAVSSREFRSELEVALEECQGDLALHGEASSQCDTMAANMMIAFIAWPKLFVLQVGSGRTYVMRDEILTQLTPDDSTDRGISIHESNVVGGSTNALEVHTRVTDLQPGDQLLLAADGLHNFVSDLALMATLRGFSSIDDTLDELVRLAVQHGADDAVSGILTRFTDGAASSFSRQSVIPEPAESSEPAVLEKQPAKIAAAPPVKKDNDRLAASQSISDGC